MNKVKTITVAIAEIAHLLSISDPDSRKAALDAITAAAENPDSIPEKTSSVAAPILERIRHKAIAQTRARNRAKSRKNIQSKKSNEKIDERIVPMIPFCEGTARRFLWLKQHLGETFDNLLRVFRLISDSIGHPNNIYADLEDYLDKIRQFIKPLIAVSSDYLRIPRHSRPAALPLALR